MALLFVLFFPPLKLTVQSLIQMSPPQWSLPKSLPLCGICPSSLEVPFVCTFVGVLEDRLSWWRTRHSTRERLLPHTCCPGVSESEHWAERLSGDSASFNRLRLHPGELSGQCMCKAGFCPHGIWKGKERQGSKQIPFYRKCLPFPWKMNTYLHYDLEILFLGTYPGEMSVYILRKTVYEHSEQISETQKAMYCMTLFMWNVQNRQFHRDRE